MTVGGVQGEMGSDEAGIGYNVPSPGSGLSVNGGRPGMVGIVPSNARHSVKALTDGRLIVVDYPLRREI